MIRFAKLNGAKKNFLVFVPTKERQFGEMLKGSLEGFFEIYKQYNVGNYIVDFYLPEVSLVIEYDENHHIKHFETDKVRQTHIENDLGVHFIRIKEGEELKGLNSIIKYLFNNKTRG